MNSVSQMLLSGLLLFTWMQQTKAAQPSQFLDGEFWKSQALEDLAPYWQRYGPDRKHGALFTALSRRWEPGPPGDKYPAMISRQVFGFCAAYLLSGEEHYLESARDDGSRLIDAMIDLEAVEKALPGFKFGVDAYTEYQTLAGFVVKTLGHVPKEGETS